LVSFPVLLERYTVALAVSGAAPLLKALLREMGTMTDSELKLPIIIGFLLFIAGLLDLLRRSTL
jgi:hypothetical protein